MQSKVASVINLALTGDRRKSGQVSMVSRRVNEDAPASLAIMKAEQKSKAARPTPLLTPATRHLVWAEGIRSKGKSGESSMNFAVASAASFGVTPS
jgi:hypothetical protein